MEAYHSNLMFRKNSTNISKVSVTPSTKSGVNRPTSTSGVSTASPGPRSAGDKNKLPKEKHNGVCFNYLTTSNCLRPAGTCHFGHREPKEEEYSFVKKFIASSKLVLRPGVKVE